MKRLVAVTRDLLSVLMIVTAFAWILAPTPGAALLSEEPCEFAGQPGIGGCDPDKKHIYDGECEGIDCYYDLEECCGAAE